MRSIRANVFPITGKGCVFPNGLQGHVHVHSAPGHGSVVLDVSQPGYRKTEKAKALQRHDTRIELSTTQALELSEALAEALRHLHNGEST